MDSTQYIADLLTPYSPQVPIEELVVQLNRFYHAREAAEYDNQHPEIHDELVPVWQYMLEAGLPEIKGRPLRVLDFGCGTGFEANILIEAGCVSRVGELVCYDLSPEMLDVCRQSLENSPIPVKYTADRDELFNQSEPFDVLITNALLHHLTDPLVTINELLPILTDDAIWIAGHEPSSRFYKNEQCWNTLDEYQHSRKYQKYVTPSKYVGALKRIIDPDSDPAEGTAREALRLGLVKKKLTREIIDRAVDCQVPHSPEEAYCGRGLDFVEMEKELAGKWDLVWKKSYNFMGPYLLRDLPDKWRLLGRQLQECHPDDGASFCSLWVRSQGEQE